MGSRAFTFRALSQVPPGAAQEICDASRASGVLSGHEAACEVTPVSLNGKSQQAAIRSSFAVQQVGKSQDLGPSEDA